MSVFPWLCKFGLNAVRALAIAICIASVCVLVDLPSLSATPAFAKDGADDGGSHESSDDHGGNDDHDDNGGSLREDDITDLSGLESGSGSSCDDTSASLDVQYADGFQEHVSDCTYVLTDRHGGVVITRSATHHDLERLQNLAP